MAKVEEAKDTIALDDRESAQLSENVRALASQLLNQKQEVEALWTKKYGLIH